MADIREVARGLRYPEGPVAMPDGSILVVEVRGGTLARERGQRVCGHRMERRHHRRLAQRRESDLAPVAESSLRIRRRRSLVAGHTRSDGDLTEVATWGYCAPMKAVAVKELKNRLSAYLREVSGGEIVLITDRGRVVAEMRRPSVEAATGTAEAAMERLHAEGVLTPGLPQDAAAYRRTKVRMKVASQRLLDAERDER